MASTNVTNPPRPGRFDLCSFLVAVDIKRLYSARADSVLSRPAGRVRRRRRRGRVDGDAHPDGLRALFARRAATLVLRRRREEVEDDYVPGPVDHVNVVRHGGVAPALRVAQDDPLVAVEAHDAALEPYGGVALLYAVLKAPLEVGEASLSAVRRRDEDEDGRALARRDAAVLYGLARERRGHRLLGQRVAARRRREAYVQGAVGNLHLPRLLRAREAAEQEQRRDGGGGLTQTLRGHLLTSSSPRGLILQHLRAEGRGHDRVVEDVVRRLLGFGHGRAFCPRGVLLYLAPNVGRYLVELLLRREAVREQVALVAV